MSVQNRSSLNKMRKNNAGYVTDLYESDGRLMCKLDIPRAEDASRVGTVVQEVSPLFHGQFVDGRGKIWKDVISHVGLVTHPVVAGQDNFKPLPAGTMALSLSMFANGDKDMADEEKPEGEAKDDEEMPTTPADGGDGGFSIDEMVKQLREHNLDLGEGVTAENFMERLHVALSTKAAMDGADNGETNGELKPEEEPVEMMAHATESLAKLALENRDIKSQLGAMRSQMIAVHRRQVLGRLHDLVKTGRATKTEVATQQQQLTAVAFALGADGQFAKHPVDHFVESREALPAGLLFPETSRVAMLGLMPEPADPDMIASQESFSSPDDLEKFLARNGYAKAS